MPKEENYIQKIVDGIITNANLGGLPPAEKQVFKENMEAQINRRLGLIIMRELDEKAMAEYEKLVNKSGPTPKQMEKFLEEHVPGYEEKVKEGMEEFIKEVMVAVSK